MITEPWSREALVHALSEIFQMVFDDERIQVFEAMSAKDVKGWDSLNHLNLIVAVEKRFSVKFKTAEVVRLKNVGELIDLILAKLSS